MLKRLDSPSPDAALVSFGFEGRTFTAPAGTSVAAALLASGVGWFRHSAISGAERAPYCMMGACFECSLIIDGRPNNQACLTPLRGGMQISCPTNHEGSNW